MSQGSRVCPYCGGLNGIDETQCYRCNRTFPGPITGSAKGLLDELMGVEFPMTKLLWGLSVVVFAACVAVDHLPLRDSFRPSTLFRFGALHGLIAQEEPWRFVSAIYVHAGILHVLFNSIALVDLGRLIETEFRSARMAVLFVLSGAVGFLASYLWRGENTFTLGASGGVFGLIGAIAALYLKRRDAFLRALLGRLMLYVVIMAVLASSIDHAAHLGGFVSGLGLGYLFELERRRWLDRPMVLLAALALLGSVASVALSTRSVLWKEVRASELLRE